MTNSILHLDSVQPELTFDQFKANMLQLERTLLINHVDPIKDLIVATTWVDYFNVCIIFFS
jgi:hypothetical protein